LGWQPKIVRKEGMQRTYAYFKSLTTEELNKIEHRDFALFKN
jgi:dTDP-glucose 4,6-dehydratase